MYGGGVMLGWRAGSGVGKYNAEVLKQGSKRFNSITQTIHFAHLGILFIYALIKECEKNHFYGRFSLAHFSKFFCIYSLFCFIKLTPDCLQEVERSESQ